MSKNSIAIAICVLLCTIVNVDSQCFTENDTRERSPAELSRATEQISNGSNTFTFELLRLLHLQKDKDSHGLFFSPFSIWSALAVTYMGAQSLTEQEVAAVLGLTGTDKATAGKAYNNLRALQDSKINDVISGNSSFNLVNRVLFQADLNIRQCIIDSFGNNMAFVDFRTNSEYARLGINKWVEDQTNGKITELIPPNSIGPLTKMVVVNAVYFKKDWLHQFDAQLTRPQRFTVSFNEETIVDMMKLKGNFLYGVSEALQCTALEIPYSGKDLSMFILLPHGQFLGLEGLDNLVRQLTQERFQELLDLMYSVDVEVSLPKFRIEDSFELSNALQSLGVQQLFDAGKADLSGFTGTRDLSVSSVRHKAFIDVNEQGTEAAAATSILVSRTARPAQPAAFTADRPFLFLIQDKLSKTILFTGTVVRPTSTQLSK